jgi:hypothetical protein
MKVIGAVGTAILSLSLAAAIPAFAQDRDKDKPDEKGAQQQAHPDKDDARRDKDDKDSHQARPNDNDRDKDNDKDKRRAQPAAARPQTEQREERREQQNDQRMDQRNDQRNDRRNDQRADRDHQRAGQGQRGRHIPDEQFRASFGQQHRFHVQRERIVSSPQPVVFYGGYNFQLVEPWPSEWSYDDDCYIDYVDDGYYLFDAYHPGFRIAVFVAD